MSLLGRKEGSRLVGLVLAPEGIDDPDPHIAEERAPPCCGSCPPGAYVDSRPRPTVPGTYIARANW